MPEDAKQLWLDVLRQSRSPLAWRALVGGGALLATLEVLASFLRVLILPKTPFFDDTGLWLSLALLKGVLFGPLLGLITLCAYRFWKLRRWDDACHICLRGGFALCLSQGLFALFCFVARPYFPLVTWLASSWPHFALWLTLNVALIWALLLLVAGFLLPSDARNTIQITDELRL